MRNRLALEAALGSNHIVTSSTFAKALNFFRQARVVDLSNRALNVATVTEFGAHDWHLDAGQKPRFRP
jgi:hypothetical protein